MASKMVRDRQNSAELVLAVEAAQGEVLQQGLLDGAVPDAPAHAAGLRAALRGALETAVAEMVGADEAHEAELADDPAAREERDTAAAAVRDQIVDLRLALSGYPPALLEGVFQRQSTPDEPRGLERYAGAVANALAGARLPTVARSPGVTVTLDARAAVTALRASRDRLTDALAAVAREVRQAQATKNTRDRAMAQYDRLFRAYASILVALFELAGESGLADRVRPSSRRPGQTRESAATPSSSSGSADSEDDAP